MKTKQTLKKIALFAFGIAVFSLTSAYAADTDSNVGEEMTIAKTDTAANSDARCPNGNPRGTRPSDCTIGQKGPKGSFGKGHGKGGCNGHFTKGRGHGGRGNVARSGGRNGAYQKRRGMGPGGGQGNGKGPQDGSCMQAPVGTAGS